MYNIYCSHVLQRLITQLSEHFDDTDSSPAYVLLRNITPRACLCLCRIFYCSCFCWRSNIGILVYQSLFFLLSKDMFPSQRFGRNWDYLSESPYNSNFATSSKAVVAPSFLQFLCQGQWFGNKRDKLVDNKNKMWIQIGDKMSTSWHWEIRD